MGYLMSTLFGLLIRRSHGRQSAASRHRTPLTLERLEDRCVPSAFSYDANTQTLTVTGATSTTNQFLFRSGITVIPAHGLSFNYSFTMNGETQEYTDQIARVIVNGNGGADTATLSLFQGYFLPGQLSPSALGGYLVLGPNGGTLDGDFMSLNSFRNVYAYIADGSNFSAQLNDSPTGSDRFVTAGTYAYMTDNPNQPSYFEFVSGASNVYAYSANPGHDFTTHYDAAGGLDAFVSSGSAYSYLSGTDTSGQAFFNEAVGFTINYAVATHGNALAYMIDSPLGDVFAGYTSYSYLYSTSASGTLALFDLAQGFQRVYAQSFVGGTDFAYNYDLNLNVLGGAWVLLT